MNNKKFTYEKSGVNITAADKFVDFKEAYNQARQFILSGKTFSHLEKIKNV